MKEFLMLLLISTGLAFWTACIVFLAIYWLDGFRRMGLSPYKKPLWHRSHDDIGESR